MASRSVLVAENVSRMLEIGPSGWVLHEVYSWVPVYMDRMGGNDRAVAPKVILCCGGIANDPKRSPRLRQPYHRSATVESTMSAKTVVRWEKKGKKCLFTRGVAHVSK